MLPFTSKLIYDWARAHHGRGACNRTRLPACLFWIVIIGLTGGVPAQALAARPLLHVSHEAPKTSPAFSLEKAVAKVRREVAGRILSARTIYEPGIDGRATHYIKVLTPRGRVIVIRIDAESGKRLP